MDESVEGGRPRNSYCCGQERIQGAGEPPAPLTHTINGASPPPPFKQFSIVNEGKEEEEKKEGRKKRPKFVS
jgi:hypothetical protein